MTAVCKFTFGKPWMLTGTGLRVFMDELELQHVNFSLSLREMSAMQADLNRSQPAGCPHPSHPSTQTTPLPLGSQSTLWWPRVQNVTSGQWHCTGQQGSCGKKLLGKGSRPGCHTPPGPGQPERTNWWLPSTLSLLSHFYGWVAAEAAIATLPRVFILTNEQGRAGCW